LVLFLGFVTLALVFAAGPLPVNLSSAGNFAILSKSGISTTGATSVVGNIGVSPVSSTSITGFGLSLPMGSAFATSPIVVGNVYAPDYASPTPANITASISDIQTAYTDAMGRTNPTATELGAGNIGGMTLTPGLYKWSTGVTIPSDLTLSGGTNDVWIFQIAQNLNISSATKIILSGGAEAHNIFWVVAGQTTIGTTAVFNGTILDQTAIVLNTGAQLNGRALAQTAVTLDANTVIIPSSAYVTATPAPVYTYSNTPTNNSALGTGLVAQTTTQNPTVATGQLSNCAPGDLFSATTGQSCSGSSVGSPLPMTVPIYNFGVVTLKNGSSGNAVVALQNFLNTKLNLGLIADGKFGPKTTVAVKQWQTNNGLTADGLVGANTKTKMNAMAN
ncbi:MAG: ice-binding family protein, partial [Minisyncoccia bacterium]